jgi:hypothetical protein
MALLFAKIRIKGIRPLLFHCFNPEILSLEKKEKTGVAGNDPEEWKKTFLANDDGQLFLEPSYIFGCLREAAKYTKSGRSSLQPKLVATLQVLNEKILFNRYMPKNIDKITRDPSQPVYLDIRSVRNPATRARNVRYRIALSPGWETEFEIIWDNTLVSRQQMIAICQDAGALVGLADGRSIGLGRFEIEEIVINEYKK